MPRFFVDNVVAEGESVGSVDMVFGEKKGSSSVSQEKMTVGGWKDGTSANVAFRTGVGSISINVTCLINSGGKGDICTDRSVVVGM